MTRGWRGGRASLVFVVFVILTGVWLVTHPADDGSPYSHAPRPVARPAPTVTLPPSGGPSSPPPTRS